MLQKSFQFGFFCTRDPNFGFNLMKGGQHVPHPIRKNPWDDPEYRRKITKAATITFSRPDVRAAHNAEMKTPRSKEKRSAASILSNSRSEVKLKNSLAHKGKIFSIEHREKIAENQRNMNIELRNKISIKMIGRKLSSETIAKIVAKTTGRKHTLEARTKMSIATKGRRISDDHKMRLSVINTGKKPSHETRMKLSLASRQRNSIVSLQTTSAILRHKEKCSKLNEWDLKVIRLLLISGYTKIMIANAFNVSRSIISYHAAKV